MTESNKLSKISSFESNEPLEEFISSRLPLLSDKQGLLFSFFGPSRSGKTTICQKLSDNTGIPFVKTSGSHLLWERYGIKSHQDLITILGSDPDKSLKYQMELLEERAKIIIGSKGVQLHDRNPMDSLLYSLYQNGVFMNDLEVINLFALVIDLQKNYARSWLLRPLPNLPPDYTRTRNITMLNMQYDSYLFLINTLVKVRDNYKPNLLVNNLSKEHLIRLSTLVYTRIHKEDNSPESRYRKALQDIAHYIAITLDQTPIS